MKDYSKMPFRNNAAAKADRGAGDPPQKQLMQKTTKKEPKDYTTGYKQGETSGKATRTPMGGGAYAETKGGQTVLVGAKGMTPSQMENAKANFAKYQEKNKKTKL